MQWEFTASATSIRDYIHMQKTFLQMNKKEGKKIKISDNPYAVLS